MPFSCEIFVRGKFPDFHAENAVAVAVSGGSDSMALTHLLSGFVGNLHALTVDHGLRPESAVEAAHVAEWVRGWSGVTHRTLVWPGEKPTSRLQEEARTARYRLMLEYCRKAGIRYLFLAHHQDDQAETFLLRLAAGSGLDGLAGMKALQSQGDVTLVRPCLDIAKADLVAYCLEHKIPFVQDPSNQAKKFARVRLRGATDVLAREGLSSKRIALTAKRMARARMALEDMAEKAWGDCLKNKETDRIVLNKTIFITSYEETAFRLIKKVFSVFSEEGENSSLYGPRTERMEDVVMDLLQSAPFRKRTLGGVVIAVDNKNDEIIFQKESAQKR